MKATKNMKQSLRPFNLKIFLSDRQRTVTAQYSVNPVLMSTLHDRKTLISINVMSKHH